MSPLAARDPNETDEDREAAQAGQDRPILTAIDHVGIAVRDLPAALDTYRDAFGAVVEFREELPDDGVEVALLKVGESFVQLLTPVDDDSPVAAFLDERGEGVHHVAYRVDDVAAALAQLTEAGLEPIDEEPRAGSRDTSIAFVHPGGTQGTLILLVEG
ncbi:MAG: methylmalonyl-CoA epimerase [Acidimicrobiales bacterium]|nr:methylmalonyl-CoA epimerase [Acidimicrobiales bacterium]